MDTTMDGSVYTPVDTPFRGVTSGSNVYLHLREDIRSGLIAPWEKLTENGLSQRFGVSRTPVREAVTRLTAEQVLERRSDGLSLSMPDLRTVEGLYELRMTLEMRGLSRSIEGLTGNRDTTELLSLREEWSALRAGHHPDAVRLAALDERFHLTLLRNAGEPVLAESLQTVCDRIRGIRVFGYLTAERTDEAAQQHLRILDSVLDGVHAGAMQELRAHIEQSRQAAVKRAAETFAAFQLARDYQSAGAGRLPPVR
ncbi:GntR family transcriptional regulator [Citricoccus sp. K5]|uniref:GntR family transcriptional regulator n=1 Tax=Citricoccus sp. K5 TaxID=2653135 RepID=UPI0012F31972|nr:GntR family transcriptional regulator [Citricoccus sp. K5]VXB86760.1 DNA-binding transcriptional regulator, GntR family [Citricoccus sp. K5]